MDIKINICQLTVIQQHESNEDIGFSLSIYLYTHFFARMDNKIYEVYLFGMDLKTKCIYVLKTKSMKSTCQPKMYICFQSKVARTSVRTTVFPFISQLNVWLDALTALSLNRLQPSVCFYVLTTVSISRRQTQPCPYVMAGSS